MSDAPLVRYDTEPSEPPPPYARPKSDLRIAIEAIRVGYSALFLQNTNEEVSRVVDRVRRKQPGAKFTVRKLAGGVRVWRTA